MLLTFTVTGLIMIMIPGPDAALIMRTSISHGRAAGLRTMLGGLIGLTVHAAAATAGLSALLAASPTAFAILRWAGVAYLLWLGVQALRARGRAAESSAPTARHIRSGLLSNLLNPKVLLFFVTFLPQFMATESPVLLSAIFAGLYALWFTLYILVVDRLGALLRTPRMRRRIERVTGVVLVGFALRLAVQ